MKKPRPPSNLSPEARTWFKKLVDEFPIDDPAGLMLLQQACEALDRLRETQKIIHNEGVVIADRFGQPRQHPATLVERDARNQLVKCIRMLDLDIEVPAPRRGKG